MLAFSTFLLHLASSLSVALLIFTSAIIKNLVFVVLAVRDHVIIGRLLHRHSVEVPTQIQSALVSHLIVILGLSGALLLGSPVMGSPTWASASLLPAASLMLRADVLLEALCGTVVTLALVASLVLVQVETPAVASLGHVLRAAHSDIENVAALVVGALRLAL